MDRRDGCPFASITQLVFIAYRNESSRQALFDKFAAFTEDMMEDVCKYRDWVLVDEFGSKPAIFDVMEFLSSKLWSLDLHLLAIELKYKRLIVIKESESFCRKLMVE